jgi:hypothetical protein
MTSIKIATLMERLRIQSILQRLIKAQGREQARETVLEAIRLEFPESISNQDETHRTRNLKSSRAQH